MRNFAAHPSLRLLALVAVVAVVAGAVSTMLLGGSGRANHAFVPRPIVFHPDGTTVADCAPSRYEYHCLQQAMGNLAYRKGPAVAIDTVDAMTRSGTLRGNCHWLAHTIGNAAMSSHPERLGQFLAHNDTRCANGVQHGVISYAFNGTTPATLQARVGQICATLRAAQGGIDGGCGHPVGHGLMLYFRNDFARSLNVCANMPAYTTQSACYDGVYMVALVNPQDELSAHATRAGDPMYPCSIATHDELAPCYRQLAERFARTRQTWQQKYAACAAVPGGWSIDCQAGMARRLGVDLMKSPVEVQRTCVTVAPDPGLCVEQAAWMVAGLDNGMHLAGTMCNAAPAALHERCFEGAGSILSSVMPPATFQQQCRGAAHTARDLDACLRPTAHAHAMSNDTRVRLM